MGSSLPGPLAAVLSPTSSSPTRTPCSERGSAPRGEGIGDRGTVAAGGAGAGAGAAGAGAHGTLPGCASTFTATSRCTRSLSRLASVRAASRLLRGVKVGDGAADVSEPFALAVLPLRVRLDAACGCTPPSVRRRRRDGRALGVWCAAGERVVCCLAVADPLLPAAQPAAPELRRRFPRLVRGGCDSAVVGGVGCGQAPADGAVATGLQDVRASVFTTTAPATARCVAAALNMGSVWSGGGSPGNSMKACRGSRHCCLSFE